MCKSLNITLSEWINPVDQDYEMIRGTNQVNRFIEFLFESNYSSLLDNNNSRKIVLIKDFPNVFVYRPEEFHNMLE